MNPSSSSPLRAPRAPRPCFDAHIVWAFVARWCAVLCALMALACSASAATFTVTSTADDGSAGTLRAAIGAANANTATFDIIQFAPGVRGTIDLTQIGDTAIGNSALALLGAVEIQGPGADVLNVRRVSGGDYRIFRVGSGAVATISGLTISGGNLVGNSNGGGIFNQGNLMLSACAISNNTAASGGGITNANGALNVQSCTVSDNTVTGAVTGGGIDNSGGTLEASNSTISGNIVSTGNNNGGGIWTNGDVTLTDCTLTDNQAAGPNSASGLLVISNTTMISNTIVAANRQNSAQPDVARGSGGIISSGGSNLIGNPGTVAFNGAGDQAGTGAAPLNPGIGALALNGPGRTRTHALLPGSPAIDRGNSALAADQRGVARPFNGDGIGAAQDDIGAFEVAPDPTGASALVVTTERDDVGADGLISLREAINTANGNPDVSTILFAPAVFNVARTITLDAARGELVIGTDTFIDGPDDAILTLSGNNASRVLRVNGGVSTINDVVIANGNGVGGGLSARGGCVYVGGSTLSLERCVVTGGSSNSGGGGIFVNGATLNLSNCTLARNNSSSGQGGAINNNNSRSTTNISGCTITDNTAPNSGGILNFGALNITNSIVAGNTAPTAPDIRNGAGSAFNSQGFNLIGTPVDGTFTPAASDQVGISNSAPLNAGLERDAANGNRPFLKDNGGGTLTVALLAGSRAVNSGGGALTEDQRGVSRPQSGRRDIGAFELAASNFTPSLIVTTLADEDNGTSDARFGTGTSLREAIGRANGDGVASAITFATSGTIRLSSALPDLVNNGTLTITGPQAGVTISGDANDSGVNDSGDVGIFEVNDGADVTLDNLTLRGGRRDGGGGDGGGGGAIFNNFGKLTLTGSTLSDNVSIFGGAIFSFTPNASAGGSDPTQFLLLRNCTLSGNTATSSGGGVFNNNGLMVIESCTIAGNSAPDGGGGGIASFGDSATGTRVSNSIVAANSASDVDFVFDSTNTFESLGFNLIGEGNATGAFTATGDVTGNTDPGLAPLAGDGGSPQTRALLPGSPAVDKGSTTLTVDQRGLARPVRLADDIGAYEVQNRQPTVTGFSRTLLEDGSLGFAATDFSNAYSDPENDALSRVLLVTLPTNGTLTLNGVAVVAGQSIAPADAANLVYTPAADFNGSDSFSFNGADGFGPAANAATVTITVTAVNDVPRFVVGPNQTVAEDAGSQLVTGFATNISAGAPNEQTQTLTFDVSNSNPGLFSTPPAINAQGDLIYRTVPDANGSATVTVTLGDDGGVDNGGQNISAPQTFTITVTAVNDAPVAVADAYATDQNVTLTVRAAQGVLGNDSDIDSASLTAVLQNNVSRGVLTLNSDGSFVYVPNTNFNGTDSFSYRASDGALQSPSVVVTLTVNAVNQAPVAADQNVTTDEDTPLAVTLSASDVENDALTYRVVVPPAHGDLSGSAPDLVYTPNPDYNGADSFSFRANDGQLDSNIATVSITVTPVNDAPVAVADGYTTDDNVTLNVSAADGVLSNDGDAEGDALTAILDQTVSRGTLTFNSDGSFSYVPELGSYTTAFSYRANDGTLSSAPVNVTIGVNVTPQPIPFGVSVTPKAPQTNDVLTATPVIADATGVSFSYAWSVGGVLKQDGPQETFDLSIDGQGDKGDEVSVVVSATRGIDSGSATNAVTVINSAPLAFNASATGDAAAEVRVPVSGFDADGDALTFKRVSGPDNGTGAFVTDANGATSFVYTARSDFSGTETIGFVALDSEGKNSAVATITIAVNAISQPINFGVSIVPKAPKTNDTLTATPVIADATGVSFSYAWSVNGVVKQDGPSRFFDLSAQGQGDRGDTVSVVVSATRGIDTGTATNAVRVFNSAPFAFSQSGSAQGGVAASFTLRGADFDLETLTYKRVGGPKNGTASIVNNDDGTATLTYTALANFGGVEVIRFVAIDELGRPSQPATLSIAVTAAAPPAPPNRAPSANNVTATTTSGVEVAIPLSGSDPDGDPLTFKRVGGPVNGTGEIRLDSDGIFKMFYTPRANFVGTEVIRFVALDTIGKPSAVATMTINVSGAASASGALRSGALRSGADAPSGGGA